MGGGCSQIPQISGGARHATLTKHAQLDVPRRGPRAGRRRRTRADRRRPLDAGPRRLSEGRARALAQQLGGGRRVAAARKAGNAAEPNSTTTTNKPAAVAHLVLGVADAAVARRRTAGPALAAASHITGPPDDARPRAAGVGLVLRRRRRRRAAADLAGSCSDGLGLPAAVGAHARARGPLRVDDAEAAARAVLRRRRLLGPVPRTFGRRERPPAAQADDQSSFENRLLAAARCIGFASITRDLVPFPSLTKCGREFSLCGVAAAACLFAVFCWNCYGARTSGRSPWGENRASPIHRRLPLLS